MAGAAPYKYYAFLSYSHEDNTARRKGDTADSPPRIAWADWLHNELETYRTPRKFVGTMTKLGEQIPVRLVPCFQDEKELPTEPSLRSAIEDALYRSQYLIVICSPRSAKSHYVNAEVLHFKKLGRGDSILPIIVAGEPNAGKATRKSGFSPQEECFCPALKHSLREDGSLDEKTDEEPVCADARWIEDKRELNVADFRIARSVLEHAKLKLIAGLLGVGFDELIEREKQRQTRARRRLLALTTGLLLIFLTLSIVALAQRRSAIKKGEESERRRKIAVENNHYFKDLLMEELGAYVAKSKELNLGRDATAEFELPMNRGMEYFSSRGPGRH